MVVSFKSFPTDFASVRSLVIVYVLVFGQKFPAFKSFPTFSTSMRLVNLVTVRFHMLDKMVSTFKSYVGTFSTSIRFLSTVCSFVNEENNFSFDKY